MLVNASTVKAIFVNLKLTFNKAFEAAPSQWQRVATLVPSTGKSNDYSWLSNFPKMRKWIGDKQVKALEANGYTLINDDFEATVAVKRNDIKDDQLGIYAPQAQDAGFSAKQWPDEIVFELLNRGFSALCYDKKPFFFDKHPVGKALYSNKGNKPLSIDTVAAARASYGAARTQMRKVKDEEGRPLNIRLGQYGYSEERVKGLSAVALSGVLDAIHRLENPKGWKKSKSNTVKSLRRPRKGRGGSPARHRKNNRK